MDADIVNMISKLFLLHAVKNVVRIEISLLYFV